MSVPSRRALLLWCALLVASCDGDGCNGGPNGPASKFCQESLGGIDASAEHIATSCKTCCLQEVPYKGTVEDGLCVCRR
jgi:hypothetical protein